MLPLIIIGTGLAGYSVAREWRKLDTTTPLLLFTADSGDFYSKPLLSTALAQAKTPEALVIQSAQGLATTLSAEVFTHTAVEAIDLQAKTIVAAGKTYAYSKLVLATGATPCRAPLLQTIQTYQVNSLDDYRLFREALQEGMRVGIVGAGLVGVEFAHDLALKGYAVSVIAEQAAPLMRLMPEACGTWVKEKLAGLGIEWYLNSTLITAAKTAHGFQLGLADGRSVECDIVLSAVGIRANIDLAKKAGLTVHDGIVVDENLQTSDPAVFALGDGIEQNGMFRQYVAPVLHQSRALAKTLQGTLTPVVYPIMPVVVKTATAPISLVPAYTYDRIEMDPKVPEKVLFFKEDKLVGFILLGEANQERQALLAQCALS